MQTQRTYIQNIFIFFFIISIVVSCQSTKDILVDTTKTKYESVNLEYSFFYPNDWIVFESSERILIAKNVDQIIVPEKERLVNDGDFIVSFFLTENERLKNFIDFLHKHTNIENITLDNFRLSQLISLQSLVREDVFETIVSQYQNLFLDTVPIDLQFAKWNNDVILGDIQGQKKINTYFIFRKVKDNIIVLMQVSYKNIFLLFSDLSDIMKVADSVEIMF